MNLEKEYIVTILEINSNLRNQLELMYKLLRTKLKMEGLSENSRLENILNELEILKTSLSFNLQKQSSLVSKKIKTI
jgi:hypothetical protein